MGVATVKFIPLPAYEAMRSTVLASRNGPQTHLELSLQTADGHRVPAQGGVQISDYSAELGPGVIELDVLGIGYPLYEKLFPGRHARYVAAFQKTE